VAFSLLSVSEKRPPKLGGLVCDKWICRIPLGTRQLRFKANNRAAVLDANQRRDSLFFFAAEQIEAISVFIYGRPRKDPFFVGVSMETNDFFEDEAQRCRESAARATGKIDREFWLNLARRWEELLQARNGSGANVEAVQALRPQRSRYNKRRWAA
jgi:hypothetical protein